MGHDPAGGGNLGQRLLRGLAVADDAATASDTVLREIGGSLGAALATLWVFDERNGVLHWGHDWAADDRLADLQRVGRRLTFAPGVGLPGTVLQQRAPAWVTDVDDDPNFPRADVARAGGIRSALAGPVVSSAGIVGVLEVLARDRRVPGPEELEDLSMAGGQLGAFLARVRAEDRLRISQESSASIVQAALDCIITMDSEGRVLDFNATAQATFGYDREEALGRSLAELIIPPRFRDAHRDALARYVRDQKPTILGRRLELSGMRSDGSEFPVELTVTRVGSTQPPLFAGFIRDITDRRRLESEQSRLLSEALTARAQAEASGVRADQAREEAERARVDEARSRERITFLARAGRIMAESMDWETTLRSVVRSAVPGIADWSALSVVDPRGRLRTVAIAHADPEREERAWQLAERHPLDLASATGAAAVLRSGRPEILADVAPQAVEAAARDDEHRRLLQSLEARHIAIAPLAAAAGTLGTLTFARHDPGRPFTEEDVDLVTSLAARSALHLQNARLYTERSHIAETLQASLRPRALPDIPGVDIAAAFLPAGQQHQVGGDFYDVAPAAEGVWTVVIGDVSGKGPEAAAVTALARHTLRTASMLHDDPAANLELLHRALNDDVSSGSFCTVFFARLCPGTAGGARMRFANGGHPAPLLLRADGRLESVDGGRGPLVGPLDDPQFTEATLDLAAGDLLLLYTDGVTEVRTSDPDLGERELRAVVAAHAGATAAELVAAVETRALELQGGDQRDDIALLAVRADPAPG